MEECNSILHETNDSVNAIDKLSKIETKKHLKEIRKGKLKAVFVGAGVGVVGVAVGILIGFFAIR